jgi:hypothetical protein
MKKYQLIILIALVILSVSFFILEHQKANFPQIQQTAISTIITKPYEEIDEIFSEYMVIREQYSTYLRSSKLQNTTFNESYYIDIARPLFESIVYKYETEVIGPINSKIVKNSKNYFELDYQVDLDRALSITEMDKIIQDYLDIRDYIFTYKHFYPKAVNTLFTLVQVVIVGIGILLLAVFVVKLVLSIIRRKNTTHN